MRQILIYADSISWGIVPGTRQRLAFPDRWPGVLESCLQRHGLAVRVIEDCLNGRRTVLDDPLKPGRNGLDGLEQRIEINSPLDLVIIMLGTNDFQAMHHFGANDSANGIGALVAAIRRAPVEPGMPIPDVMVVAPPAIQPSACALSSKFLGAEAKSVGLNVALRNIATAEACNFFDAGTVTSVSPVDGVHLDKDQHRALGEAIAESVAVHLIPCYKSG